MPRKKHSAEEIISKLREAEVVLAQGKKVPEVRRLLGVTPSDGTHVMAVRSTRPCPTPEAP
jgi:hypothetical protein